MRHARPARVTARLAGLLYAVAAVPAGFSVVVFAKLMVRGDAAATAARVLASEGLFRLGIAAEIVGILIFVVAMLFLYELFRPASRRLALLAVFFALMGAGIQALDTLSDVAAVMLLKGGAGLAAFTTDQAQALAFVLLRMHLLIYTLGLAFFGASTIAIGALLRNATFLPRALSVLMVIDGLGYLVFALATFLAPPVAVRLHPFLPFATAAIGEGSLILWLIVKGVDAERWEQQAAEPAA